MKRSTRRKGTVTKGVSDASLAAAIVRKIEKRIYDKNKSLQAVIRDSRAA